MIQCEPVHSVSVTPPAEGREGEGRVCDRDRGGTKRRETNRLKLFPMVTASANTRTDPESANGLETMDHTDLL